MADILSLLQSPHIEAQREGAFLAAEARMEEAIPLLVQLLHSPSPGVQEAVDMALRHLGGRVTVEALLPLLRENDPVPRNLAMDLLRSLAGPHQDALLPLLTDPDPDVRIFTADILGACGDATAVPPLCDALLHDPDVNVRYQAAVSLGELGYPEAASALNRALGDDEWVRFAVIEALMKIGHESSIQALAGALKDSSELVASMIVDALAAMGNRKAAPLLLARMHDAPDALRNKMVRAVVRLLGPKALSWLPEAERASFGRYLRIALDDEDPDIQDAAMHGLGAIGNGEAAGRMLALAATINPDQDPERLEKAIEAIASLSHTSAPALEAALDAALHATDDEALATVAVAVSDRLGTPEAALRLAEVFPLHGRDMQRRMSAVMARHGDQRLHDRFREILATATDGTVLKNALAFLGTTLRCRHCAPEILDFLQHPYNDVKEAALEAAVAIGGPEVEAHFLEMAHSPAPLERFLAAAALGRLGAERFARELTHLLQDPVEDVRRIALDALAPVAQEDAAIREALRPLAHDESAPVRLALAEAAASLAEADPAWEELVAAFLDDNDDWVRVRAMETLAERRATRFAPRLITLVQSDNTLLAIKAVETLGRMGGQAAFHALLAALANPNPDIQAAAERALDALDTASGEMRP
jgi:HEAT repeat protein